MNKHCKIDFTILMAIPLLIGLVILPAISYEDNCQNGICKKRVIIDDTAKIVSIYLVMGALIYSLIISPFVVYRIANNKSNGSTISKRN